MKIYIAGKITGNPDYVAQFAEAEAALRAKGHSVMNPARIVPAAAFDAFDYRDSMRVSRAMQNVCEAVYFLPNWKDSDGARQEHAHARATWQRMYFKIEDVGGTA